MKQSGIEVNAHVCIQAWAIFVYDCAVFGDTFECVYEVMVHAFLLSKPKRLGPNQYLH